MRLTDVDEAYKVLTDYYHHRTDIQHEALKDALSKVPTADAEPIRHGHWIYTERGFPLAYGYNRCSVCGRSIGLDSTDYCPNCGAKMDEVTE